MSNSETFKPVGLVEISRQIKSSLKKVDDLEERLHSALDAKRDVASSYVKQLDPARIEEAMKRNDTVWKAGYDVGYFDGLRCWGKAMNEGLKAGTFNPLTEDELSQGLVHGGISLEKQEKLFVNIKKMIKDYEDEHDQHPDNYGGTK